MLEGVILCHDGCVVVGVLDSGDCDELRILIQNGYTETYLIQVAFLSIWTE